MFPALWLNKGYQRAETRSISPERATNGGRPWWTGVTKQTIDNLVRSVSIETANEWSRQGETRNLSIPFLFMNDASRDQSPLVSYGEGNIIKLRQISHECDPIQLF
ncbi:hypothetical protein F4778DRAFT_757461 [Xylariomycetidae sp. FL2044]|nr:hypothetical protein F4778DRAFT_757461 [Xylariomycetidae sp. FL2044]